MSVDVVDLGGVPLTVNDVTNPGATPGVIVVAGPPGPPGPPGASGGSSTVILTQTTPLATWSASHSIGHKPTVAVIVGNELVIADVEYPDDSTVVVTHASPQTGMVVAA